MSEKDGAYPAGIVTGSAVRSVHVVIATHNGGQLLPRLLEALGAQKSPGVTVETTLVDNASTDNTREVVEAHQHICPVEYVFEPTRGKNRALNRALKDIAADLIVFTDDDTEPAPDWLKQLVSAANRFTDHQIFGGAIIPAWPHTRPAWLTEALPFGTLYAATDPGLPEGDISAGSVWGPNMAIRGHVFDQGYRFNEAVGPGPGNYAMGSETELTLRLQRDGARALFTPSARVAHRVRAHQMRLTWVLGRAIRSGRGVRLQNIAEGQGNFRRWMLRDLAENAVCALIPPSYRQAASLWVVFHYIGYLYELARARK